MPEKDYNDLFPVKLNPEVQINQSIDWKDVGCVPEPTQDVHNIYYTDKLPNIYWSKIGDNQSWDEEDEFLDISEELYRCYVFDDERLVIIWHPEELFVCDYAHTIIDENDVWHTVPYGWISLEREFRKDV